MSVDYSHAAKAFYDEFPHPLDPSGTLKVKDFATAVKLATMARFGGHASPHEAARFWPQFQQLQMSPGEFEHALSRIAPVSFTYHGRPPTMQEIGQLRDKHPKDVRSYFAELPDKTYPHVSAGDIVTAMRSAEPHAQRFLNRAPNKYEAQYLVHSKEHPRDYYRSLAEDTGQATKESGADTMSSSPNNVLPLALGRNAR